MARRKKSNGYIRRTFTFDGKRYSVYGKTAREAVEKEANRRKGKQIGGRYLRKGREGVITRHCLNTTKILPLPEGMK